MSVIGNKERLGFEVVPVAPDWETRYAPERAAWAGIAVWVGGQNLCANVPPGAGAIEDFFYIPLCPVADWTFRSLAALEFEERAPDFPTTRDVFGSVVRWAETHPVRGLTDDQWFE